MKSDEFKVEGGAQAQARAWLIRLKSGDATQNDLRALGRWRQSCAVNEQSYQAELRMWQALGPAMTGGAATPARLSATPVSRRWVLGGATGVAASALAGVFILGTSPAPAGATVFETSKGEQRKVRLADGLNLQINTDSRLYFWSDATPKLVLDKGEAVIAVDYGDGRHLLAQANDVEIIARQARFVLRSDGDVTKIACLDGALSVRSDGRGYALEKDKMLVLGQADADAIEDAAADADFAWQRGLLVFKDRPAGEVVAELNRYRPGHVYLPGDRADVKISGVIHLDRADLAVDHIARSLSMRVVRLPGGMVFLRG